MGGRNVEDDSSRTRVDVDTRKKLQAWLANNERLISPYPVKPSRYLLSSQQECYTSSEIALMRQLYSAYTKMEGAAEKTHFDVNDHSQLYGWWKCITTAHTHALHQETSKYTLPNRDAKDLTVYPLWDYANNVAAKIANWQAQRAKNQNPKLMNDPVMLVFEELRDWFFNTLANKEGTKEDLITLMKRQNYIKTLVHLIPDFGRDKLNLYEIQHHIEDAYKIVSTHLANRELPQLLSDVIVDAKNLERVLVTHLHFLLVNEPVADNFELSCLDELDVSCRLSPIKKIYQFARIAPSVATVSSSAVNNQQSPHLFYQINVTTSDGIVHAKPVLRTDMLGNVKFATFMTDQDKHDYIELLAIFESLKSVRDVLENFRQVQSSIGIYFFSYQYLEKTVNLAANYINLVMRANHLLAKLLSIADEGLRNILKDPKRHREMNREFEHNLRTLETRIADATTNKNMLDAYTHKAIASMDIYKGQMKKIVMDIWSGKASEQVGSAMNELFIQIDDLNNILHAVINDEELSTDTALQRQDHDSSLNAEPTSDTMAVPENTCGFKLAASDNIRGEWDTATKRHPQTNVPIYTYRIYYDGVEIGSADYYGQPSLCVSIDGGQHNILKTTGFLNELPLPDPKNITTVCVASFPTLMDRVIYSSKYAAGYGCLRGASNILDTQLQASGYSKRASACLAQCAYYSSYFLSRLYVYNNLNQPDTTESNSLNAMYMAAYDTGQMALVSTVLNGIGGLFNKVGKSLEDNKWTYTGKSLQAIGSVARYGVFAASAVQSGVVEAGTSLIVGTCAELATEGAGKFAFK